MTTRFFALNEDICAEASKYIKDGGHIWGREGRHNEFNYGDREFEELLQNQARDVY